MTSVFSEVAPDTHHPLRLVLSVGGGGLGAYVRPPAKPSRGQQLTMATACQSVSFLGEEDDYGGYDFAQYVASRRAAQSRPKARFRPC